MKKAVCHDALPCPDCRALPCTHPKRKLDDCCACSGEVCGDRNCPAIELVVCEVCERGNREDELLLCDGCDHACHLSCMRPRLAAIPATWFCQRCRAAAMEKRRRIVGAGVSARGAPAGVWTGRTGESVPAGDGALANGRGDAHDGGSPRFMVDAEFMRRLDQNKTKLCNCKKSRCLKQYCECFREKEFCSARCNCTSCLNLPGHRRPGEVSAGYLQETSMQLTADAGSARVRVCTCKRSRCLKKYCECYQHGQPCHSRCTCVDCGNNGQHAFSIESPSSASPTPAATASAGAEHKRCAMRMEEWKIEDKRGPGASPFKSSPFKWADQRTTSRLNLSNGSTGAGSHTRPPTVPAALDPNCKERERELGGSDSMRLRAILPHELPKKVQVLAAEAFLKGSTISQQGLHHVGENKGDG